MTCLELRITGAGSPNGRKNKPRGLVEDLGNPIYDNCLLIQNWTTHDVTSPVRRTTIHSARETSPKTSRPSTAAPITDA